LTDSSGYFEIPVEGDTSVHLLAEYGDLQAEKAISPQEGPVYFELDTLHTGKDSMEEMVVVGYRKIKRSEITGAIETFDEDDILYRSDYQYPQPINGYQQFKKYIHDELEFPDNTDLKRAVVVLTFLVGTDGKLSTFEIIRSPGNPFSKEAIRLIMDGPEWLPAKWDEKPVETSARVRIVFRNE